jgi:phosphoribosyl-ATP pyrophosphohydrolase
MSRSNDTLERLESTLEARRNADADSSYVASLFARGEDAILQKVGEEATEFLLASKSGDAVHLVKEAADVWFHMLVLMKHKGLGLTDILEELERREGLSGLEEKASRPAD